MSATGQPVQIPNIELQATTMPGLDEHGEPRFLENVKMFLERAAKKTSIPDDVYEIIESCASVIRFNVPLVMDNGELRTVTCYRAQHSTHQLPVKGGTRYAADIDIQVSTNKYGVMDKYSVVYRLGI